MEICPQIYRPRRPRESPLYVLLESLYEQVKLVWEERFEKRYGFWRGLWDGAVARYLDCGIVERGFARVRCDTCAREYLLAFSCKARGVCPSCGAKRAAEFAAFLQDEVAWEVGHAQWVLTIPKMLRIYFLYHRELVGELSRAAYETIHELMAAAVEEKGFRPGVVTVVQTFGGSANFNPHVHAIATRGGWTASGVWVPVPYVDERAAERLFAHKILRMLREKDLLSERRIELLLSWRRSGFSVHNRVRVDAGDARGLEALARYLMRSPVSLARMKFVPELGEVIYTCKNGHGRAEGQADERVDAMEFIARVLVQIPEPRRHSARYYGFYSCAARGKRRKAHAEVDQCAPGTASESTSEVAPVPARIAAMKRTWAELIRRIYEVDPLVCRCGGSMRVISFITQPRVIERILDHLRHSQPRARGSPRAPTPSPALA